MEIKSAEFVVSNAFVERCPQTVEPEFAFIGRSNVGKSSLINAVTGRKALAKTSATPGKTMLINHFIINNEWYLVDLPGYGYAKRSKKEQQKLEYTITRYVLEREQMVCLFVLIDVRHPAQKIDLEFIEWLGENGVPFAIVFTKADKVGRTMAERNVAAYKRVLLQQWEELPAMFVTSSETRWGCDALLDFIDDINKKTAVPL